MADKYEDLADRIAEDFPPMTGPDIATLRWLDEHRDQVPGRTLTRGDMVEAFGEEYAGWATSRLARVGYTAVPDSEPTNAERLAELIREIGYDIRHNGRLSGSVQLAMDLDNAGVKAPEGGDEPDDHV